MEFYNFFSASLRSFVVYKNGIIRLSMCECVWYKDEMEITKWMRNATEGVSMLKGSQRCQQVNQRNTHSKTDYTRIYAYFIIWRSEWISDNQKVFWKAESKRKSKQNSRVKWLNEGALRVFFFARLFFFSLPRQKENIVAFAVNVLKSERARTRQQIMTVDEANTRKLPKQKV